jgi:membrane-associated protease RseP (regulator of RpoE activity)
VLWYYAIGFVLIWTISLLFRKHLKIDIEGPLIMRRTGKLRDLIESIAQKSPKFWRWSMNVGIPVAVLFMIVTLGLLIIALQNLNQAQVSLIIPGVQVPGSPIFVPFSYGILALITVIVVHEFGHGIIARMEKIRIKSIGVGILAIIPMAFVEPNEEDIEKSSRLSKLRVFSAGSIFNFGFAAIALLLFYILSLFIIPIAFDSSMEIMSVVPNSPSAGVLQPGMIIQNINGYKITDLNSFNKATGSVKVGDLVTFQTNEGTFTVKAGPNPSNPKMHFFGISSQFNLYPKNGTTKTFGSTLPWILIDLTTLLQWIFVLNFGIGSFNLLPIGPLDGGQIFRELLSYVTGQNVVKTITNFMSIFSIALIVINVVYPFIHSGVI